MNWQFEQHGPRVCFIASAQDSQRLMAEAEAAFDETGEKQRLFDETEYQARTWDRHIRFLKGSG